MNRNRAISTAIAEVDRELHTIDTRERELTHAPAGQDVKKEMRELMLDRVVLERRREGLEEQRAEARAQDQADELKAKEAEILSIVDAAYSAAGERAEQAGAKLDAAVVSLGDALRELQAANEVIAAAITKAMRMTPSDYDRKRDLRIIIQHLIDGSIASAALASKLRANGVGEIGIPLQVIWNYGTLAPDDSVRECLADAAERLKVSFGHWLASCIESVPKPEPMPSRLSDQERRAARTYAEMSPEEHKAAALAASGQRPPMTIDDFGLSEEEKEEMSGAFAAAGVSSRTARINGHPVQLDREPRAGRKPKGKA